MGHAYDLPFRADRHDAGCIWRRSRRSPCASTPRAQRLTGIADELTGAARRIVEAKCLYALQLSAGELRGAYADADAERYARRALEHDAAHTPPLASRR